jgi:hypothetical protein
MSKIEVYKELGTYERHFNQMQSVYRGLASTWLLATFAGIGYVFHESSTTLTTCPTFGGIDVRLAASMISLAGGTGIFLLWIIDVMVYHKLLVAVTEECKTLEEDGTPPLLPRLRERMQSDTVSRLFGVLGLSARHKISLFYGIPAVSLLAAAFAFFRTAPCRKDFPVAAFAIKSWLGMLGVFVLAMFAANRKWSYRVFTIESGSAKTTYYVPDDVVAHIVKKCDDPAYYCSVVVGPLLSGNLKPRAELQRMLHDALPTRSVTVKGRRQVCVNS